MPDHRENIARATLSLSDVGARLLGGPSKTEAIAFLKSRGFSQREIDELSGATCKDCSHFREKGPTHCWVTIVKIDGDAKPCNQFSEKE